MIHAIPSQYLSICCKTDPPSPTSWWIYIQAKLKQVAMVFFSLVSLFLGCSFIFYSVTAAIFQIALFALPCFCTAGYCLWSLFRSSVYDNPVKLEAFRIAAKNKPLEMLITEHGLDNIFNYAILSAEEFSKKYEAALGKMALEEALDFYEMVAKVYQDVGLPEAYKVSASYLLRGKWKQEKQDKSPCSLLETYELQRLLLHGVINNEMTPEYGHLLAAKNEFDTVLNTYNETLLEIEKKFQKECFPFLATFKVELANIEKQAQDKDAIQTIQQLLQRVDSVRSTENSFYIQYKGKTPNSMDELLNIKTCPSKHKEILKNLEKFHRGISEFKKNRNDSIKKCEHTKKEKASKINDRWKLPV